MLFAREYDLALSAARAAATLISTIYATDFSVEYKGIGDPVTDADRQANDLIVSAIHKVFPDDAVCAEEGDAAHSASASARGGRCWFVDPIDGTKEFVDRNGEFCVMIGLSVDGAAALGVLVAPVWKRTFAGIVGVGAWEVADDDTRTPCIAPTPRDAPQARIAVSRSHRSPQIDRTMGRLGITHARPCGSVGLKVALVASGEVDVYVHSGAGPKLWDGCAPEAVARAAGATVTDAQGRSLRYDTPRLALDQGIVVARAPLHALAQRALAESLREQAANS